MREFFSSLLRGLGKLANASGIHGERRTLPSLSRLFLGSQRQFTLILQARDEASTGVIEEASFSGIVLPGPTWHTLNHEGRNAHLAYRVRVQCADHYYNATCTKFCRPRNDIFGHYTCDENGDKVCIQGWKGADCEIGESLRFVSVSLTPCRENDRYTWKKYHSVLKLLIQRENHF